MSENKEKNLKKLYSINEKILELLDKKSILLENEPSLNSFLIKQKLLEKLNLNNYKKLDTKYINQVFNEIYSNSFFYDNEKIVYLGPEGSYTHEASINLFGTNNNYYSVNSIKNIFFEVEEGRAKYGVVPIENSSNGIVGDTINCFDNYNLNIIGETVLDIHHTLVSNCSKTQDIKIIYSKDIAFDQCSIFLENYHLNEVKYEYVDSTTKAAKLAAKTPNSAAICSKLAAKTHNIPVLFESIEDKKDNKTRFLIISKFENERSNNTKTSIIVKLPNTQGSLISFLNDFKKAKINLNKIKSHIVKGISTFFIEFEGDKNDKEVQKIIKKHNSHIKVLGSYMKQIEDI